MISFLIFYLIAGVLITLNYLEPYKNIDEYKWFPLTWFFVLIYNVFFNGRKY